jgi:4-diphosphocytidyl-2-C-methyl-D-erythritol kinase
VQLIKRIPAGGGLGGGSTDAAAVLRWAGCDDLAVAVSLGADVPFCVVGGRARVRGIGEAVEPLPFEERTLTLLTPPLSCPTPAVYRQWDAMGGPSADGPNDLEPAALRVEPELARWRDVLGELTGHTPVLAGSGSTWFVDGSYPDVDGAVVVRTVPPGWS